MFGAATQRLVRKSFLLVVLLVALGVAVSSTRAKAHFVPCCSQCEGGYDVCVGRCAQGDTTCVNKCESRWHGLCYTYCNPSPSCDCDPVEECSQ